MNTSDNKPSRKPASAELYAAIMKGRRKTITSTAFQRAISLRLGTKYVFDNCKILEISDRVMVDVAFLDCEFTGYALSAVTLVECTFRNCSVYALSAVTLVECTFRNCSFKGTFVRGDFVNCLFERCDFTDANYANMRIRGNCAFRNCTGIDLQAPRYRALPVGQFTAYKRVPGAILELLVSKKAQRVSAPSNNERKYRVSKVKVKRALREDGTVIQDLTKFHSLWEPSFTYEVGKWAEEPSFDPDPTMICTRGIHIFLTFEEARDR